MRQTENRPTGEDRQPAPAAGLGSFVALLPKPLLVTAAYAGAVVLIWAAGAVALRILSHTMIVVVPLIIALLLTALLSPLNRWLRASRLPSALAAAGTLLTAALVVAGFGTLIWIRGSGQYGALVTQVSSSVSDLRHSLTNGWLHLPQSTLSDLQQRAETWLGAHRSLVAGAVLTGLRTTLEWVIGFVLALFITFFLLRDGQLIWGWLLRLWGRRLRPGVDAAGRAAWQTLVGYVHGTAVIAAFHGVVIGLVLFLLGVPLVIPLALLVAAGSFIPLAGALAAGGVAVLITFTTQGLTHALVLLGVLLVENQIEAHLLQPFVVGRYVKLHPLAVALALTAGGAIAGILGALIAVPLAASINAGFYAARRAAPDGA